MSVLILGDIHFPYQNVKALSWAIDLIDTLPITTVVQVGDLYDMFAYSRFPKLVKQHPAAELEQARQGAEQMWTLIRRATNHKAKCYQLMGNHDDRPLKTALNKAPELLPLVGRSVRELFTFQGVTTVHNSKQELIIDGVCYQHGHRSRLGEHAEYNRMSTVCGHSHRGGLWTTHDAKGTFWELNVGFLGDVESDAFAYHSQKVHHKCTLGAGVIDSLGPRFIPFP